MGRDYFRKRAERMLMTGMTQALKSITHLKRKGDRNALPQPIRVKPHRHLVSEKNATEIKLCR